MTRLLLGTGNPGKVRELRRLLARAPVEVVTPRELGLELDVPEEADSYAENAATKARAYAEAGGCLALADDSGIEVDALGGQPGVRSARYGGAGLDDQGRLELLLRDMEGVPAGRRTARYRALVAVAAPADYRGGVEPGSVTLFEATMEGSVAFVPRGENGFGYDPIFMTADGRTAAELGADEKDAASHRGKAVRAAAEWLAERLG